MKLLTNNLLFLCLKGPAIIRDTTKKIKAQNLTGNYRYFYSLSLYIDFFMISYFFFITYENLSDIIEFVGTNFL